MDAWWLSFVVDHKNVGVCIVDAEDIADAAAKAHRLGINPGGQVMGWPLPADAVDLQRFPKNVLLNQEQLKAYNYRKLKDVDDETRKAIEDAASGSCHSCNEGN